MLINNNLYKHYVPQATCICPHTYINWRGTVTNNDFYIQSEDNEIIPFPSIIKNISEVIRLFMESFPYWETSEKPYYIPRNTVELKQLGALLYAIQDYLREPINQQQVNKVVKEAIKGMGIQLTTMLDLSNYLSINPLITAFSSLVAEAINPYVFEKSEYGIDQALQQVNKFVPGELYRDILEYIPDAEYSVRLSVPITSKNKQETLYIVSPRCKLTIDDVPNACYKIQIRRGKAVNARVVSPKSAIVVDRGNRCYEIFQLVNQLPVPENIVDNSNIVCKDNQAWWEEIIQKNLR